MEPSEIALARAAAGVEPRGGEEIFVRILDMDRRKLGEDHPDYGNSLNNLAHIRMQQGDPAAAAGRLADLYQAWGRPADAARYRAATP